MGKHSEAQAGWMQGRAAEGGQLSEKVSLCSESDTKEVSLWFQPERNKTPN